MSLEEAILKKLGPLQLGSWDTEPRKAAMTEGKEASRKYLLLRELGLECPQRITSENEIWSTCHHVGCV